MAQQIECPSFAKLNPHGEFAQRHIGPDSQEEAKMLQFLGLRSLEELANKVIPPHIRSTHNYTALGEGLSEHHMLQKAREVLGKNQVFRSFIGMGYADTITPSVILRNILENPVWYTAYTPYQAEISQGRLEALLNFQTMISDLTRMEIANASLLDEGTACAEAMAMSHSLCKKKGVTQFLVDPQLHPQSIEVLKTRAAGFGFKLLLENPLNFDFEKTPVFGVFLQYPTTSGAIIDYRDLVQKAHSEGALVIAATDLLALTLLTPPGEWGADIVVGNSQRFGVPLGFGGPHAAFMATKDAYKRIMPGRLVGVSVDAEGQPGLRLALQTREQHIRREKATSNICTAQVLLANMASMYAVYHGPLGLKQIAQRIWRLTGLLSEGLKKLGFQLNSNSFFDTLQVNLQSPQQTDEIIKQAHFHKINFRIFDTKTLGITLDETCDLGTVDSIWSIFNLGKNPGFTAEGMDQTWQQPAQWAANCTRTSPYLQQQVFNSHHSETELLRYIHVLQNKDVTLTHSMIPLGSCTMKLNATTELLPVSWPEVSKIHPFAPLEQAKGFLEMFEDLENKLKAITGFAGISLQPNAGSQGEYAGLLVIRKYFETKGENHRNICLIPSSAHGTNPASAAMVGMQVVVTSCDEYGNVDLGDLKAKAEQHKKNLACLMITYPSTHGVFEESIQEICQIIHQNGGQVYMDGANMNALVGFCRPGEYGPDVMHLNLHKTFAIPHGGGGPGVGPIGVAAHLCDYLPGHALVPQCGPSKGISATTSAPWGSASILPISWTYITMMGAPGLKRATLMSILNANYIAKKLDSSYPVLYKGRDGFVAHECILDLRPLKKDSGIDVTDVAKRLMDYGFHAPTMSFPVAGTLMVEPTESESLRELDTFIEAMTSIRKEIAEVAAGKMDPEDNVLKNAPHSAQTLTKSEWKHPYSREKAVFPMPYLRKNKYWPAVARIDNAYGDRNLICSCPSIEEYASSQTEAMDLH